jgi:hypothetical protein
MLHVLSPEMSSLMPNLDECRALAHKWVREQVARYGEEGNDKLFPRYKRLLLYFGTYMPKQPYI